MSNISKLSQSDYAKWLANNKTTYNDVYELLTARPEHRELLQNMKSPQELPYYKDKALHKKAADWVKAHDDNALNIKTAIKMNANPITGLNAVHLGQGWTGFDINGGTTISGVPKTHHKGYLTFKNNLDDLTPGLYNKYLNELGKAGYKGAVKVTDNPYKAWKSFDNVVFHGATESDRDMAMKVAHQVFGDKIQGTMTGEDGPHPTTGKHTSHTAILEHQVEQARKGSPSPFAPPQPPKPKSPFEVAQEKFSDKPKPTTIPEDVQKKIDEANRSHNEKLDREYNDNLKKQHDTIKEMDNYNVDESIKKNGVPPRPKSEPHIPEPEIKVNMPEFHIPRINAEEGSDFWMKALKTGAKFATNDKVMAAGKFIGKMNYLRFTNPMWYVGIEAFNSVRDALVVDGVTGKKSTPMDVLKDAVGMAGFGYVMDMAMMKGGQALARSKYGSELAGGAVDALLKKVTSGKYAPTEEMFTVGDLVAKSMQKFIKPVDLGPLKLGAVGMAAGLLYAGLNNKKDGIHGTAFDMISGAGLVMLGHEMYHHLKKSDEPEEGHKLPTAKDFVQKNIEKIKGTESGYLGFEAVKEVLNTEPGQDMKKALDGLLNNTEEGKYFKTFNKAITDGNWESIVQMSRNPEEFTKNLDAFHNQITSYFMSSNGIDSNIGLSKEAMEAYKTYGKDFSDAVVRDISKVVHGHVGQVKSGFKSAQTLYEEHQETIHTMLRRAGFSTGELDILHKGMTEGITKTVKKLDDITSKEVVNGPQIKDVTEQVVDKKGTEIKTSQKDVKKQSEDVAHNKENNKQLEVSDLTREGGKADHIKSQDFIARERKLTGWKEKAKVVGALGLGAFAVATALDISERLDHKQDVSKMTNTQKKNNQKKAHQQIKDQRQQSYGYINMGDMVHQMFQDRIGHHQMGNAKFAPNQYSIQGQTYTI